MIDFHAVQLIVIMDQKDRIQDNMRLNHPVRISVSFWFTKLKFSSSITRNGIETLAEDPTSWTQLLGVKWIQQQSTAKQMRVTSRKTHSWFWVQPTWIQHHHFTIAPPWFRRRTTWTSCCWSDSGAVPCPSSCSSMDPCLRLGGQCANPCCLWDDEWDFNDFHVG